MPRKLLASFPVVHLACWATFAVLRFGLGFTLVSAGLIVIAFTVVLGIGYRIWSRKLDAAGMTAARLY